MPRTVSKTVNMLVVQFLILLFFSLVSATSDIGLNTVELIRNHGYVSETHYITTEDGYILTFHRLPHGKNNTKYTKKLPVLLMHGLGSSSADFVNMGPQRSLAYFLADSGYDVWMGNARGNAWSRNHTDLHPVKNAKKFYDFSWHEIGYYDLPAAVDYILNVTNENSLFYVGHSQGCTVFLVMAATRPEYNKKIKLASLMAPAAFMESPNRFLKTVSSYVYVLEDLARVYKIYEIPFVYELRKFLVSYCQFSVIICGQIFTQIGGNPAQDRLPVVFTNYPSNAALKQVFHYLQLMRTGGFLQYDYRAEQNKQIYGSSSPPHYNLSKVSAPVAVYYSKTDRITSYKDSKKLIVRVPNVVHTQLLTNGFEHIDYVGAKSVVHVVYKELKTTMRKYSCGIFYKTAP